MRSRMEFFEKYITFAKSLPTRLYIEFFAFTLAIYLSLIGFQIAIITFVIPQELIPQYFYLTVNSPNLSSMSSTVSCTTRCRSCP